MRKKPLTTAELALVGLFLFALYLALLFFRSGLASVTSAVITGLVIILIEVLLLGFSSFSKRLRRASREMRTLAKTTHTGRKKRHL